MGKGGRLGCCLGGRNRVPVVSGYFAGQNEPESMELALTRKEGKRICSWNGTTSCWKQYAPSAIWLLAAPMESGAGRRRRRAPAVSSPWGFTRRIVRLRQRSQVRAQNDYSQTRSAAGGPQIVLRSQFMFAREGARLGCRRIRRLMRKLGRWPVTPKAAGRAPSKRPWHCGAQGDHSVGGEEVGAG